MARIIVADDEPNHREMVITMLARAGHRVIGTSSGLECLAALEAGAADLVLADIFMPNMNGMELVSAIRSRKLAVPVVGMSGGMGGSVQIFAEMMKQWGAVSVLAKPFSAEELRNAIDKSIKPDG